MQKQDLVEKLNQLGVKRNWYVLDGERLLDAAITVEEIVNHYGDNKSYRQWEVSFHERGERDFIANCNTPEDAYAVVYAWFEKRFLRLSKASTIDRILVASLR